MSNLFRRIDGDNTQKSHGDGQACSGGEQVL